MINKIKEIVNENFLDDVTKKRLIFNVISEDKDAIPNILSILDNERQDNKTLLIDTNEKLSIAFVCLQDKRKDTNWLIDEIKSHYKKWSHKIICNFNVD